MYERDLAFIHHDGFAEFARRIAPGVLAEMRRAGIRTGRVLDLGCGDGTWLRALVGRGYTATGIDQSRGLIRFASKAAPGAVLKVGSLYREAFPRCEAVTALGEVFSYCPNANGPLPSIARLWRRVYEALRPGGVLIFDVLVSGRPMAYDVWRTGRTWAVLARVNEDPRRHRLTREIVTFRKTAGSYRRGQERHVLRVFSRQGILRELGRIGFRAISHRAYGRVLLPSRRVAFVARKPRIGGRAGEWPTWK